MISRWWLKRLTVAIVFCLIVRTVWLIGQREWLRAEGNREFAAAVAETELHDADWSWEKLEGSRTRPAPGKNSTEVIRQVSELSPKEWLVRNGGGNWAPVAPSIPANTRYPERVVNSARELLASAKPAVELAFTLEKYPQGYTRLEVTPDVISTLLPHVDETRHAASLLTWGVELALETQDPVRAYSGLIAMLNTSRAIGDDPLLVCQLVRMATRVVATRALERTLAHTQLGEESLRSLQAAWASDAEEPLLLNGLRGERALMDLMFKNLTEGVVSVDGEMRKERRQGWFSDYAWWLYRVRFLKDRAYYHRYMTQAVEIAKRPIHEQPNSMHELLPLPDTELRVAQLFIPAVEKCAAAHWRTAAESRCAVVGIACERFRLKHGRWPATLDELCPEFLPAVPLDPYDGEPLQLATQDDGIVIHSVGTVPRNGLVPVNRPGLPEGIEIGFRLWNPDARRLPPSPEPPKGEDDQ